MQINLANGQTAELVDISQARSILRKSKAKNEYFTLKNSRSIPAQVTQFCPISGVFLEVHTNGEGTEIYRTAQINEDGEVINFSPFLFKEQAIINFNTLAQLPTLASNWKPANK